MARVRSGGRSVMVASSGGGSSRRLSDSAFRFGGQSKTWSSVIKYCVLKSPSLEGGEAGGCHTGSVRSVLADLANKLGDYIPVAITAGMIQLVHVLHGLGLYDSRRRRVSLRDSIDGLVLLSYTHGSTCSGGCRD